MRLTGGILISKLASLRDFLQLPFYVQQWYRSSDLETVRLCRGGDRVASTSEWEVVHRTRRGLCKYCDGFAFLDRDQ